MCVTEVYHNTFADGTKSITERTRPCSRDFRCPRPTVQHIHVTVPMATAVPPVGGFSGEGRSRRNSGIWTAPSGMVPPPPVPAPVITTTVPLADFPPRSRPITIQRSNSTRHHSTHSTMPPPSRGNSSSNRPYGYDDDVLHYSQAYDRPALYRTSSGSRRHRSSRTPSTGVPRIVTPTSGSPSAFPTVVEPSSSSARLRDRFDRHPHQYQYPQYSQHHHRQSSRDDTTFLHPRRARAESSPQGYTSAEDAREYAVRRRRRSEARDRAATEPSSAPSDPSPLLSSSPRKELRWADKQRDKHNARISHRPKVISDSGSGSGVSNEPKSILKPTTTTTTATTTTTTATGTSPSGSSPASSTHRRQTSSTSSRRSSTLVDDPAFLDAFSSIRIRPDSRDKPLTDAEQAETERLRNRFTMPPRRYTGGGSSRRLSEVWYPDEGRVRYY